MADDEISEAGRRQRFARWDELGLDRVKADLLAGGHQIVGGPPQVQDLAWEWVRIKEAKSSAAKPPTYARDVVIAAAHMLKALGHSGINEFLLETGLPDHAATGSGLQARATSLAKYAIENPTELSPARRTVPFEIIRRATELWRQETENNLRPEDRNKFEMAMKRDGQALVLQHGYDDLPLAAGIWSPDMPSAQQLSEAEQNMGPKPAKLTVDQMRGGIIRLEKRVTDLEAFDVASITGPGDARVTLLAKSIEETLERVFGTGTGDFSRYKDAARINSPFGVAFNYAATDREPPPSELQTEFSERRDRSIALLNQAIKGLEEEVRYSTALSTPLPSQTQLATKQQTEMVTLKPGIWGMSIDLKEVARRVRSQWRRLRGSRR